MRRTAKGCLAIAGLVAAIGVVGTAIAYVQGSRTPEGPATYVAMGSSFAAGAGLGALQSGSPWLCARSVGGYPPRLARSLDLTLTDRSCGGATAVQVLGGGQFFQPAQLDAIGTGTRLVTLTAGGNDIGYIGDLSMLAARRSGSLFGRAVGAMWDGPATQRDWDGLEKTLVSIVTEARRRAPTARIVVATYTTLLPPTGTCPLLSLSEAEAATMRAVGDRLAAVTASAAKRSGAVLVDMHALGRDHHACARDPWTYGWTNAGAAPFHPTARGAEATAQAIARALEDHQQL